MKVEPSQTSDLYIPKTILDMITRWWTAQLYKFRKMKPQLVS